MNYGARLKHVATKAPPLLSTPARIVEYETIDSTNDEAHRRAAAGERGPLWIRSDQQQSGRGRSGRPWSSPPGNLSATHLFTPDCPRSVFHHLSFVAGIAAYDAVATSVNKGAPLQLKWPNDLLIGAAKVGGILVESSKYDDDVVVMIGIGINIAVAPPVDGRAVTQLGDHGTAPTPSDLVARLADAMAHWISRWDSGRNFASVRAAWSERAHAIGRPLMVNTNERQVVGAFNGLAENGALLLTTEGGETLRIEHGDVSLVATSPASEERA